MPTSMQKTLIMPGDNLGKGVTVVVSLYRSKTQTFNQIGVRMLSA